MHILVIELEIAVTDRFNISTLRPSRPKALLFGIDNICLKKSSLTGGIINLVSLFILLSTKLEIISTDVGGKLDFLTGVYLSAIVAKYLFNVSAIISGSEIKLPFIWRDIGFFNFVFGQSSSEALTVNFCFVL